MVGCIRDRQVLAEAQLLRTVGEMLQAKERPWAVVEKGKGLI